MKRTGFVWHESYAWYDAGVLSLPHVEPLGAADSPESKRRFRNLLDVSGLLPSLHPVAPISATDEQVSRVHSADYLSRLERLNEIGGEAGPYVHLPKSGLAIAQIAAGGAIAAVDAVLDGVVDNVYALVRPAGHHATREGGMGFCIFNNVAIAAAHARAARAVGRIAIVDWDVHHGNGLQDIFWNDGNVLTVSIHQDGIFGLSRGVLDEAGLGNGAGCNLNVALPAGSGHGAYVETIRRVVVPALRRFQPDLILVASGLDALYRDPLGRMMLHSGSYREMTRMLMEAADEICGGRLAMIHEGGYSAAVVPFAGLAILEQLSGRATDIVDPFLAGASRLPGQDMTAAQAQVVADAASMIHDIPAPKERT